MVVIKLKIVYIGIAVLAIVLLYFFMDARYATFFPKCPFYMLTGLLCTGCGSQRALSSLLHGDLLQALQFNILLVATIPLLLYSGTVAVVNSFRKIKVIPFIFYSPVFVKTFLIIIIVFTICRNVPYFPFTLLAPHTL